MQEILKNETEEKVYSTLDKLNIKYDRVDHKPVFTAEEAKSCVTGLIKEFIFTRYKEKLLSLFYNRY